jgi:hypothetical protein
MLAGVVDAAAGEGADITAVAAVGAGADMSVDLEAAPLVHTPGFDDEADQSSGGGGGGGKGGSVRSILSMLHPLRAPQCVVRIRGAPSEQFPEGAECLTAGRMGDTPAPGATGATGGCTTSIVFDIPEGVKTTPGMAAVQKTPKDKAMYFVDVSMDGGMTFEKAEVPLLFLK